MSVAEDTNVDQSTLMPQRAGPSAGRIIAVALMIISLAATALLRGWVVSERAISGTSSAGSSLDAMPSFATALLLGGLRGPLVMILWTSSESQKQEHDLQDLDTKIEWIRLLQPEFDTVHLFQIWNKAYNISVQMSSLSNKYATIIDALDYAQKVDRQRPDDVNIISEIGRLWYDKLGGSAEKFYYTRRIRHETLTLVRITFPSSRNDAFRSAAVPLGWEQDESPLIINSRTQKTSVYLEKPLADRISRTFNGSDIETANESPNTTTASGRRMRLEPVLDADGNVLPGFLAPRFPRPDNIAADQPWYDGSELQFLRQYQPFPYGVSAYAMGYAQYKRAQLLLLYWHQHHIQEGDSVLSSRPAIAMEGWAKDEWDRGRRAELRMWGHPLPQQVEPNRLEVEAGPFPLNTPVVDTASGDLAAYSYKLAARVWADARQEFQDHIKRSPAAEQTFLSHIDDTIGGEQMMLADSDYLAAASATGDQRRALLESAAHHYVNASQMYCLMVLKYFTEEAIAARSYPIDPTTKRPYTRVSIKNADPSLYFPTFEKMSQVVTEVIRDPGTGKYAPYLDSYYDDRTNYAVKIQRCLTRIQAIRAQISPATAP